MIFITLALLVMAASGAQINVGWTLAYFLPSGRFPDYQAAEGDRIVFDFSSAHDVWKMHNEVAYEMCNFGDANQVAWPNWSGMTQFTYTVTAADADAGKIYFACSTPTHCDGNGRMKIAVTMLPMALPTPPPPSSPPALPPTNCDSETSEMPLPCDWFAVEAGRCSLVPSSSSFCPEQCPPASMRLPCSWYEEDPATRCPMIQDSQVFCASQCGSCPGRSPVSPLTSSTSPGVTISEPQRLIYLEGQVANMTAALAEVLGSTTSPPTWSCAIASNHRRCSCRYRFQANDVSPSLVDVQCDAL